MAASTTAFMTRQFLTCTALRYPLALPSLSLHRASTRTRTFTSTRFTSASVKPDNNATTTDPPVDDIDNTSNLQQQLPKQGSLTKGSIFAEGDEEEAAAWQPPPPPSTSSAGAKSAVGEKAAVQRVPLSKRDRAAVDRILNVDDRVRATMERKYVIAAIRRRGRMNKVERISRTERECVSRSQFFKTSVKKLTKLARQIAGKSLQEALLQMKFSPKKVAKDVSDHLELSRDKATVMYGMGIGKVMRERNTDDDDDGAAAATAAAAADDGDAKPVTVVLKNGKKRVIKDPTNIYIAQAWVNRGRFDRAPDYRARGQVNMMRPPHTGLTVLLKEEKTLIREARERHEKALRQRKNKVWTQLPDRPISAQSQYYSW
ncbi:54S ribosomal protein L22, mitochondrial [Ascosphaera aggregata]|nr:54S ribosomal protein L22, mitochondrial [Ascosphaera aggregata]